MVLSLDSSLMGYEPTPQTQVVLNAFKAFANFQFDELENLHTEDYTSSYLPTSLKEPEICGRALYIDYVRKFSVEGMMKLGEPYTDECITIFHLAKLDDGSLKIKSTKRFSDASRKGQMRRGAVKAVKENIERNGWTRKFRWRGNKDGYGSKQSRQVDRYIESGEFVRDARAAKEACILNVPDFLYFSTICNRL